MSRTERERTSRTRGALGLPAIIVAAAVLLAAGVGGVVLVTQHAAGRTRNAALVSHRKHTPLHHSKAPLGPPKPLSVVSVSPAAGARGVAWSTPVTVRFNQPLGTTSPLPTLLPSVPGSWDRVSPATLQFDPAGRYVPYSRETVVVPAASRSARGLLLGSAVRATFTVRGASVLRLQELLAELGYLPVSFTAGASGGTAATTATTPPRSTNVLPPPPGITGTTVVPAPAATATTDNEPSVPADVPLQALPGTFTWRFKHIPAPLAALWSAGQPNVITTGAVMSFENANGLAADGVAGPVVWTYLLRAVAAHQVTTAPYDWVYVSVGSPEYVTVWRNGVDVFTTLANTGIPQAPTQAGTWPVFLRYTVTTMSGTNPDGSHYSDPGIPWVSYFNGGDALHGFLRAAYGFPQSLGCVEMTYAAAGTVWPYTPLGTLVTVQ